MTDTANITRARRAITGRNVALTAAGVLLVGGWSAAGLSQADAGVKPGAGSTTFVENCSVCHTASMSLSTPRTSDGWREIINKMIENGAEITPEEFTTIHGYLAANYNSEAPAPSGAQGGSAPAASAAPAAGSMGATPMSSGPAAGGQVPGTAAVPPPPAVTPSGERG